MTQDDLEIWLRNLCVFGFPNKCNQFCNFHYTIQCNKKRNSNEKNQGGLKKQGQHLSVACGT